MTVDRFVECQHCGWVYQLPTMYSHLQFLPRERGKWHYCYATYKPTFDQMLPWESREFREITLTEARVWRGPLIFIVPAWYQPEYHLLAHAGGALEQLPGGASEEG